MSYLSMGRVRDFLGLEASASFPAFAWPGGYLIAYYVADSLGMPGQDMYPVCADCANGISPDAHSVSGCEVLEGDYEQDYGLPAIPLCEVCNKPLDPAERKEKQTDA